MATQLPCYKPIQILLSATPNGAAIQLRQCKEYGLFTYKADDGVPSGIRTRVAAVKGQCPRPLDDGDVTAEAMPSGAEHVAG
jgi:hypothetical protein